MVGGLGWVGFGCCWFMLGVYRFCVYLGCLDCGLGSVLVFGGFCCSALYIWLFRILDLWFGWVCLGLIVGV